MNTTRATITPVILSLDPSSTKTGWAVLGDDGQICEAGHLTPDDPHADAAERIAGMAKDLRELLEQVKPSTILIEWPSGHVGKRRHRGGGAGLAVYGCAVGALWQTCETWADEAEKFSGARPQVVRVPEDVWCRRQGKGARAAVLAALCPTYDQTADPGLDAADAAEMALWWIEKCRAGAATWNTK